MFSKRKIPIVGLLVLCLIITMMPAIAVKADGELPTITSVYISGYSAYFPAAANNGNTATVTITGTYLRGVTAVTVYDGNTPDALISTVNIIPNYSTPDTKFKVDITVNSAAAAGTRNITVTTPSGTSAVATGVFTVYRTIASIGTPSAVSPGATFDVYINISNIANIDVYQFDLLYNNSVISVVGNEGGPGVSPGLIGQVIFPVDGWSFPPSGAPGRLRSLGNLSGVSGICGQGYLAKITFQAVGAAGTTSPLTLLRDNFALYDGLGVKIIPDNLYSDISSSIDIGLSITNTSLPDVTRGLPYSCMMSVAGGITPYTWTATGLPAGLSINSSTGLISGTATATGQYPVTITVTDSTNPTHWTKSKTLPIVVYEPLVIISASPLPTGRIGTSYSQNLTATGGLSPYSWSIQSGTLPAGLSLSASGLISGTPTTITGSTGIVIKVMDSRGVTATKELAIAIVGMPSIATAALPFGVIGIYYSQNLTAAGGLAPYSWTQQSGLLPASLTLSGAGVINGTPTTSGNSTFSVMVTDSLGGTASTTLSLNISDAIVSNVTFQVGLQGGSRPNEGFIIPLTVKLFSPGTTTPVDVLAATPVYTFNMNTTKSGAYAVAQASGVSAGTYDISVVSTHCLVNVKRGVGITSFYNIIELGMLLDGNANDDIKINIQDFGVLASTYGKSAGESGYNAQADFDRNNKINIQDFGLLASSYGKISPVEVP